MFLETKIFGILFYLVERYIHFIDLVATHLNYFRRSLNKVDFEYSKGAKCSWWVMEGRARPL